MDIRKRQIISSNSKLAPGQKQNMVLKKGVLSVNKSPYRCKIEEQDAAKLLNTDFHDIESYDRVKAGISDWSEKDGSKFLGMATAVSDIDEIRLHYKHFKLRFADATHVMMAYRLPGINMAYDEDYFDDGEYSGGRRLHKILLEGDHISKALFVVRYYGGKRLGKDCFDCITDAAKSALSKLVVGDVQSSTLSLYQPQATATTTVKRRRMCRNARGGYSYMSTQRAACSMASPDLPSGDGEGTDSWSDSYGTPGINDWSNT